MDRKRRLQEILVGYGFLIAADEVEGAPTYFDAMDRAGEIMGHTFISELDRRIESESNGGEGTGND